MSPPLVTGRRRVKQQLAGLLFLAVLAGVVGLTVALYQKAFTPVVMVTLEASSLGNQLTTGGDVKAAACSSVTSARWTPTATARPSRSL
jgi:hypothetical protein